MSAAVEPRVVAEGVSKWFGALVAVSDVSFDIGARRDRAARAERRRASRRCCACCAGSPGRPRARSACSAGTRGRTTGSRASIGLVPQQETVFEPLTARRSSTDRDAARAPRSGRGGCSRTRDGRSRPRRHAQAARVLEGDAPAREGRAGARPRPARARPRRAADRPRSAAARSTWSRSSGASGARAGVCIVSSHVLDEVERLGSRILVMSQGRLAAAGDFHELRALMDDRPLRVRVRTDRAARARRRAARGRDRGRRATRRRGGARARHERRPRAGACARARSPASEVRAFRGRARSTPTSKASFATWCRDEHRRRGAMPSARPERPRSARSTGSSCGRRSPLRACSASQHSERSRSSSASSLAGTDDPAQAAADAVASYGLGSSYRSRRSGSGRPRSAIWSRTAPRLPVAEARAALAAARRGRAGDGHRRRPAGRASRSSSPPRRRGGPARASRLVAPRSPASPTRACSSRPGSGSGARSGGGSRSCCSGRTPARTDRAGTARFTVTSWARSIVSAVPGVEVPLDGRSAVTSLFVLPAIALGGWLAATIRYQRLDVD